MDELLKNRTIELSGQMTDELCMAIIAMLLFLQSDAPQEPIRLLIDSTGGKASVGIAIIETIRELSSPVHTSASGVVGGMAALVLASGRKGNRLIHREAKISIAKPMIADGTERARQAIVRLLADLTVWSEQETHRDLLNGLELTPEEAVTYGFADDVYDE